MVRPLAEPNNAIMSSIVVSWTCWFCETAESGIDIPSFSCIGAEAAALGSTTAPLSGTSTSVAVGTQILASFDSMMSIRPTRSNPAMQIPKMI